MAIVTGAVMNIHGQVLESLFSVLWGLCLGVELLGPIAVLCFNFLKNCPDCFLRQL